MRKLLLQSSFELHGLPQECKARRDDKDILIKMKDECIRNPESLASGTSMPPQVSECGPLSRADSSIHLSLLAWLLRRFQNCLLTSHVRIKIHAIRFSPLSHCFCVHSTQV